MAALVTLAFALPAQASATGEVRAALLKFAALRSYEMTSVAGVKRTTSDFINPDRVHISWPTAELIRIGATWYWKRGGKWMKTSGGRGAGTIDMPALIRKMTSEVNGIAANALGTKLVRGESFHVYRITQSDGTTGTLYIGPDGLPRRFQSKNAEESFVLSKFNAVPPILAPM